MAEIIDVRISQEQNGSFDLSVGANGDLETVAGFDTAILMSVFCERRASADQVPTPRLRRGWIGNEDGDDPDFEIGSLIWLYEQARLNSDTANGVESHANTALAWFLEDNLLTQIETEASFSGAGVSLLVIFRTETGPVETRNFELWKNTGIG